MMLPARLWRLQENVSSLICKNGTEGERFETGKLVGGSIFGGERVTVRAGRAAHDLPPIIAGVSSTILPRSDRSWHLDGAEMRKPPRRFDPRFVQRAFE